MYKNPTETEATHVWCVEDKQDRSAACRLNFRCIEIDLAYVGDRTLHCWCHLGNLPPEKLLLAPPTVKNVNQ